jgi:hypothetical protein
MFKLFMYLILSTFERVGLENVKEPNFTLFLSLLNHTILSEILYLKSFLQNFR